MNRITDLWSSCVVSGVANFKAAALIITVYDTIPVIALTERHNHHVYLCSTDITRSFFSSNMLFSSLKCKSIARSSISVPAMHVQMNDHDAVWTLERLFCIVITCN